jgi:hypothetical protein
MPNTPFCFNPTGRVGTACNDPYDTFRFTFTGENISGVSIDPASAQDFQPPTFGSHLGQQFIGPNAVEVAGDNPAQGDSLILDLAFAAQPPPPPPPPAREPEPASLWAVAAAAGGMFAVRRRRPRR